VSQTLSKIWTIPASCAFTDVLAAQLLAEVARGELVLEDATILLPNRRAVRSLQEAFLRQSEAKALLLPRLMAVGDLDSDELEALDLMALPIEVSTTLALAQDIPEAIGTQERRLLLARLILAAKKLFSHSIEQALAMADELARLLDQCQTEAIDLALLDTLAQETELSEHWQKTLEFLTIIRQVWPALLAERQLSDPAERRHRLMMLQAQFWAELTPPQPFILAGSTGSIKATRALMKTVLGLPRGRLVLPGLDTSLPADVWDDISTSPSHPQYGFALLRQEIGFDPASVPELEAARDPRFILCPPERLALVQLAMLPAKAIAAPDHGWQARKGLVPEAWQGVSYLESPDGAQEAANIALALRHALETPERTAALVTPDRGLARRVQAELARFGVLVEESAGTPLKNTALGAFVRLTARLLAEDFAPVELLSVLKHPMARLGYEAGLLRRQVRALELLVLRGPRPAERGFKGLTKAVTERIRAINEEGGHLAPLERYIAPAQAALARLAPLGDLIEAQWQSGDQALQARLACHFAVLELLAALPSDEAPALLEGDDIAPAASPLWQGEEGQAFEALAVEVTAASAGVGDLSVPAKSYAEVFDALMGDQPIRKAYGTHPRLAIWGTMEARLQKADLMILGGLNEGVWPVPTDTGPWMSRPMRAAIGLPSPERKIGLSAHDFCQAFGARQVMVSRAAKQGTAPSVRSRWLARLDSVLPQGAKLAELAPLEPYAAWSQRLRHPEAIAPRARPAALPPVDQRPQSLSVTHIRTWMRNPYDLYAKKILGLSALDPIDADPSPADRGNALHQSLEDFLTRYGVNLPPEAEGWLLAHAKHCAETKLNAPLERRFWQERLERIIPWFIATQRERLADIAAIQGETQERWALPGLRTDLPFVLKARADRVDRLKSGGLTIIDYKTGQVPSLADMRRGLQPQLPLEAVIAQNKGWGSFDAQPVASLEHWRLHGGRGVAELKIVGAADGLDLLIEEAEAGLRALVEAFFDPEQAYYSFADIGAAKSYDDYQHLHRMAEWQGNDHDG
jgi:ATP-dependent helicase/nuclease subunit B